MYKFKHFSSICLFQLLVKSVFTIEPTVSILSTICAGCPVDSPITAKIKEIADWTATQLPNLVCKYCSPQEVYSVESIKKAQTQVVAGTNYFLTIDYETDIDPKIIECDLTVWEKLPGGGSLPENMLEITNIACKQDSVSYK